MEKYSFDIDYSIISDIARGREIVSFGEATHRVTELHRFACELFKYLVTEEGFRVMVFESAWALYEQMQGFFAGEYSSLEEYNSEIELYFNAFYSEPTKELMFWIRDYNRSHPDDPIIVAGYQPEQPVTDSRAIKELCAANGFAITEDIETVLNGQPFYSGEHRTDLEALSCYGRRMRSGERLMEPELRERTVEALKSLSALVEDARESFSARDFGLLNAHLTSLTFYVDGLNYYAEKAALLSPGSYRYSRESSDLGVLMYTRGDAARFKIFNYLKESVFPGRKIYIWQHIWHAFKYSYELGDNDCADLPGRGAVSFGTNTQSMYGQKYALIGSILAKADDSDRGSIDYAFKQACAPEALVDLSRVQGLPIHDPRGRLYETENDTYFENVDLAKQCDGIFYTRDFSFTYGRR